LRFELEQANLKYWLLIACLLLTGCGGILQTATSARRSLSTLETQNPNILSRTATPTFIPITFAPTATPLFRATKILIKDYGQSLTLFIGDKFTLERLAVDKSPLTIDNQHVLKILTDPNAASVELQAVGLANARVSSFIEYPCPDPPNCQPPVDYTYLFVTVVSQ
jgi:hypothetical protein